MSRRFFLTDDTLAGSEDDATKPDEKPIVTDARPPAADAPGAEPDEPAVLLEDAHAAVDGCCAGLNELLADADRWPIVHHRTAPLRAGEMPLRLTWEPT